jgi:Cu/Ag efflux protein CusF
MGRIVVLAALGIGLLGLMAATLRAEEGKDATQTKTGIVKKVDLEAKQIIVMVKRELTFAVTDATKIVQGDAAKKLADIKVDAKVSVEYTRAGDTRTAVKITILPAEK